MVCFFLPKQETKPKLKHLVQTKTMGENIITNIMKLSIAGTRLKESDKKFTSKINNSQQAEEIKHCNFRIYCQFHRPQRNKFPRRLR